MSNNYGVKASKENIDIIGQIIPNNLIFSSAFDILKIHSIISSQVNLVDADINTKESATSHFRHGFGYRPAFFAYYTLANSSWWWLDRTSLNTSIPDAGFFRCTSGVTPDELQFKVEETDFETGGVTSKCKAALFVNPIELVNPAIAGPRTPNNWGMKIAKNDINVIGCRPQNLIQSSSYESLLVHSDKTVSFTIPAAGGTGQVTFEHGLGYVPLFWAMITDFTDTTGATLANVPFGQVPQPSADSVAANRSTIRCDALKTASVSDITYKFRVIVFKNKLSDV